eukprot:764851-Hanusia_phi.AAC.10
MSIRSSACPIWLMTWQQPGTDMWQMSLRESNLKVSRSAFQVWWSRCLPSPCSLNGPFSSSVPHSFLLISSSLLQHLLSCLTFLLYSSLALPRPPPSCFPLPSSAPLPSVVVISSQLQVSGKPRSVGALREELFKVTCSSCPPDGDQAAGLDAGADRRGGTRRRLVSSQQEFLVDLEPVVMTSNEQAPDSLRHGLHPYSGIFSLRLILLHTHLATVRSHRRARQARAGAQGACEDMPTEVMQVGDEVAKITEAAMRGEIDFKVALLLLGGLVFQAHKDVGVVSKEDEVAQGHG